MSVLYKKSGYLYNSFKIFYLKEASSKTFEYHYHDFHKVMIFLQGSISYAVEGREYDLLPGDTILIPAGQIHRPIFREGNSYERIIAYISQDFFDSFIQDGCDLFDCFSQAIKKQSNLVRFAPEYAAHLNKISETLAHSFQENAFGSQLYQKTKFTEYLILLNRFLLQDDHSHLLEGTANTQVLRILDYINQNITEDLSIDSIANEFHLNRSYIMHLFKAETGYTIGKYITEKRLFLANYYVSLGDSMTDACFKSGFRNYTTFYQAYKNKYHCSPKQMQSLL